MCFFLLCLLCLVFPVGSSFVRCEHRSSFFPIHDLYADPPDIVAANQEVHFRIDFGIPDNTYLTGVHTILATNLNGLPLPSHRDDFRIPPGGTERSYRHTFLFPSNVWGRLRTDLTVYNASGASLLCVRWSVFATNTAKNATSHWF